MTGLLLVASPAAAHDSITGTSPADGETLTEVPGEIVLSFSAEPLEVSPEVVVTDGSGAVVSEAPPQVDGIDVIQPLPEGLTAGTYDVVWRVVSSDGHPIDGSFSFTLDVPDEGAAEETTESAGAAEETTSAAESTTSAEASITQGVTPDGDDGGTPWGLIAGAAGVVALIVAVAVVAVRRARDPNGPAGQH